MKLRDYRSSLLARYDARHLDMPVGLLRILHVLFGLLMVLVLLQCVSGMFLSFSYLPSTQAQHDSQGRVQVQAQVIRDLVDADNDTLYRAGEWCRLMATPSGAVHFPLNDSSAFLIAQSSTEPPSIAWLSVYQTQSHEQLYGAELRSLHHWCSYVLMACAMVLIVVMLGWRVYRYRNGIAWMRTVVLIAALYFCAWLGSVLAWDERAQQSLTVVGSFLEDYVPLLGTCFASLLGVEGNSSDLRLQRMFLLHILILPAVIIILLRYSQQKLNAAVGELHYQSHITFGHRFLAAMLIGVSFIVSPTTIAVSMNSTQRLKPEWYLLGPYQLIASVPEDLAALLLGLWWFTVFALVWIGLKVRREQTTATIGIVMAAAFILSYVYSWVL